jgi:hypothetical protein
MKVKVWIIERSDKAILVSLYPQESKDISMRWIPRSVVPHISTLDAKVPGQWQPCVIEIEDWFWDRHCADLQKSRK